MKKLRIVLTLVLCVVLLGVFFVGCSETESELIEGSPRSPFSSFSTLGTLKEIEIKGENVYLSYTYTLKVRSGKMETVDEAKTRIDKAMDDINKNSVGDEKFSEGKRAFELKESKVYSVTETNDKNESVTNTKIDLVVFSKYLSNVSYITKKPLEEYIKSYDINKTNFINKNGEKVDLSKIKKQDKCYYVRFYNISDKYKGNIEFKIDGKILTAKDDSSMQDAINSDSITPTKDAIEFIYTETNNTLLWVMLPIAGVCLAGLVVVLVITLTAKKRK